MICDDLFNVCRSKSFSKYYVYYMLDQEKNGSVLLKKIQVNCIKCFRYCLLELYENGKSTIISS